jgi:hypothetical protein
MIITDLIAYDGVTVIERDREEWLVRQLGEFVLLGRVDEGEQSYPIGPALGDLDSALSAAMFATLEREVESLLRSNKVGAEYEVSAALELAADALFRIGKTEQGVGKLQRFLDEYPTSTRFSSITRKINAELGVERTAVQDDLINYPDKGLQQCDYFALARGAHPIIHKRVAVKGVAGLVETIAEIERSCGNHRELYWNSLYSTFARAAAGYGECELSRAMWRKYLAHGGSRTDLDGYQRSQPGCVIFP